ncbi:hypothetical protein POREN0001_2000 [Porphyromonas endodontalis ATCC 35406]|uniref:Uncharacterized protein n=1 Tax=Porphyromonas endodontalis (strain ATCC 35406 / DSM 24491 / JCM 8526 / CCUG 16442 / BCRC 14492 / NCTC 13058 / HG 370) TaxID=553175 RepID=C3JCA9_POREA|nr:hypothetical protein POREN0001_2000 [Porphyromonas endodontalis ATCC 35406]
MDYLLDNKVVSFRTIPCTYYTILCVQWGDELKRTQKGYYTER